MENQEIRFLAKVKGVPLWKIALEMGISDMTLYRKLRVPLSADMEAQIRSIIDRVGVR